MRTLLVTATLVLLLAPAAPHAVAGEDLPRAADVTDRGRDVDRILDLVLAPRPDADGEGRVLALLLDVTASLQRSDFAGEFEAALARNERSLARTRIAVAGVGDGYLALAPTLDRELTVRRVQELCARPRTAFQNVYAAVRHLVKDLKGEQGERKILLVTLENGDAEDDVERTVLALERSGTRLSVICREAFVSDSYWILKPPRGPPGTTFTGSEAAFVEVPWGLRFQWGIPNNGVLSGYAMYGLTRLAAATDGRVYLYYPPSGAHHVCCGYFWCRCLFCDGDHAPEGTIYQSQRLKALSPLAASRRDVLRHAVNDPWYRAVQRAWESAARNGLVYSRPTLDLQGGTVRIERNPYRGWTPLGTTVSFGSEIARARRLLDACDAILDGMRRDAERARDQGGSERYRAIAETTRLMLYVTRFNLLHYVAFCEEVGPEQSRCGPESYEPPEAAAFERGTRFRGIGYWNLSLCHGVEPFRAVRLPGGADLERERFALQVRWDAFLKRWDHTPYAALVRKMGLTHVYLLVRPGYLPPGRRRVPDTEKDETVTLPERPARPSRPGGGTSAGGGGQATGGE